MDYLQTAVDLCKEILPRCHGHGGKGAQEKGLSSDREEGGRSNKPMASLDHGTISALPEFGKCMGKTLRKSGNIGLGQCPGCHHSGEMLIGGAQMHLLGFRKTELCKPGFVFKILRRITGGQLKLTHLLQQRKSLGI